MKIVTAIFGLLFMLLAGSSQASDESTDLEQKKDELLQEIRKAWHEANSLELARFSIEEYQRLFGSLGQRSLDKYSNAELVNWFRAATEANFYAQDEALLSEQQNIFAVLERRQALTDYQLDRMHKALVAQRDFEAANALAAAHPEGEFRDMPDLHLPETFPANQGSWLALPAIPGEPIEVKFTELDRERQVLVAAHPYCHFTQGAFEYIDSHPEFAKLFQGATLVTYPDGVSTFEAYREWAGQHPDFPIHPAYDKDDWPMPDWATPTFYFMANGEIVATVVGWVEEETPDEWRAAFKALSAAE